MWGFIGCYNGSPIPWSANMTSLSGSKDLTPKKCQDECRKKGFDLAALRNGDECYCHNNLDPVDKKLDDLQCDSRCIGDKDAKCGGSSGELAVGEDKDNKVKRPKAKVASSSLGLCSHRRKNGTWRTVCDSEAAGTGVPWAVLVGSILAGGFVIIV